MQVALDPPRKGPPGNLLVGNFADWKKDPFPFLQGVTAAYGDFVPIRFGPWRAFYVSRPELIEDVLVHQQRHFIKDPIVYRVIGSLGGNGLINSDGDFWRTQRRLMQPAFHRKHIAEHAATMVSFTERMMARWRPGEVRDLHKDMIDLAMEILCKALFSADISNKTDVLGSALTTALEIWGERLKSMVLLMMPPSVPIPSNLRFRRAVRQLDTILYQVIQQRRATMDVHPDLMSMLLHARFEDDGSQMTDQQLRDEVMTLFIAGHETGGDAMAWALYELSRNAEAEARLREEVDRVLGGRAPTVEDVPNLRYTAQVISEVLRLYPTAPYVARTAIHECRIGDYVVPAGSNMFICIYNQHRDPRYFQDPEAFRPERWEGGLEKSLPKFAYFPFGGGPRLCIGNAFFLMEGALILASLFQRFRFTRDGGKVLPHVSVGLRPKGGLPMCVHPR
jgi:cytochrome P450